MNVLAIGAHPDDIEICCAGTLAKYKKTGHDLFIALATSGNQGSNTIGKDEIAAIREDEAKKSAKILGANIRFMRYDDEGLIDSKETRRSFINCIRWANPDVILTHYPKDKSTDHGLTGELTTRVLLSIQGKNIDADEAPIAKLPSVFYFDTGAGVGFLPDVYVDITDQIDIKKKVFSQHKSQEVWMKTFGVDDFSEYVELYSRYRGLQAGVKYAEGYKPCVFWNFIPDYKLLP
jgi:LmbE family N-acetylglucosaminyl deacetylase